MARMCRRKAVRSVTAAFAAAMVVGLAGTALAGEEEDEARGGVRPAGVDVLGRDAPWRVFLVTAPPMEGTAADCRPSGRHRKHKPSPFPPERWRVADFDDGVWGRYGEELGKRLGGYGYWQSPWAALLCLRTRFGVSDPGEVDGLRLNVTYRGGAVVYLNGNEIARAHMPEGGVEPLALAEDYPPEAFFDPGGKRGLPRTARPAKKHLERYEMRIRTLDAAIPRSALREGANSLAVEIHRTAMRRTDWSSLGFYEARLTAAGAAGLVPYADAARGLRVWNASSLATVAETQTGKLSLKPSWDRGPLSLSAEGGGFGNPFDPLRPVRLIGARNGVASGQVVVSFAGGLRGVRAEIGSLRSAGGETLPRGAAEVRYAVQQEGARYCDALMKEPREGATVQPVWVMVEVPADQAPGWYTGTLAVRANGEEFAVPVELLVSAWRLPDPKEYVSHASLLQSPDSVALKYGVEPLSERHFELMAPSLELMGQVGNDVAYVPVIHGTHMGHETGMVRWVRRGARFRIDLGAMERYLDLYAAHCGPPKVLCLVVWKPTLGNQRLFRGVKVKEPQPLLVTELDRKTGRMSALEAPMFGEEGSDEFWKPMIDGARRFVRKRGWDERSLMLGQAFDSRPLAPVIDFFNRIDPGARWVVYSHWVGDPKPGEGPLVVSGGMEVGYREEMGGGMLPELRPDRPELARREYITAGSHRIQVLTWSSPTAYRNIPNMTGTFCRLGLDFWPVRPDRGRLRSVFNTRICGPWLYKAHPVAVVAPGPDGAVPTVRFQMLREGVQETEARISIVKSMHGPGDRVSDEKRAALRELLDERAVARSVAEVLTQAQISLDWLGLTSRVYAAAAGLAGEEEAGTWDSPPSSAAGE